MKKSELLKIMNQELLDKLFGFCYARTADSHEAEELCSDIIFALVKSAQKEGRLKKSIHVSGGWQEMCMRIFPRKRGNEQNVPVREIRRKNFF